MLKANKQSAVIDDGRTVKNLNGFKAGDYVLVSMGAAIEKITEKEYFELKQLEYARA